MLGERTLNNQRLFVVKNYLVKLEEFSKGSRIIVYELILEHPKPSLFTTEIRLGGLVRHFVFDGSSARTCLRSLGDLFGRTNCIILKKELTR